MSFQYACFINTRHSDKEKTVKFIEQFVDALENSLDQRLQQGVYIDRDRLKAGVSQRFLVRRHQCIR